MDEPQTRAALATIEVVGKLMAALVDTGALPPKYAADLARGAAERLEPIEDGAFLDLLAEQWLRTARFVEMPPST